MNFLLKYRSFGSLIGILIFGYLRWLFPASDLEVTGWRAVWDTIFTIGLYSGFILLALASGVKILNRIKLKELRSFEKALYGLPLGMGLIAYGVLGLGLIGILSPFSIICWLLLLLVWTWKEWNELLGKIPRFIAKGKNKWRNLSIYPRLLIILAGIIFLMAGIQSLAPPWDYDGLMYHLVAPKIFLEQNQIVILPDIHQANSPLTVEMMYLVGMSLGTDTFARLVHLTFAVLLLFSAGYFGRLYFGPDIGWLAMAILLGIPFFPILGTFTYVEMAWSLFEVLALFAFIKWTKIQDERWLLLSGICLGLGMGTKYFALANLGVLGIMLLLFEVKKRDWKSLIRRAAILGGSALLIASPWYLKNLFLTGNPIYPMYFGGPEWAQERIALINYFMIDSFGTGRTLLDYFLLPWNIYAQHELFNTYFSLIEYPAFIFPLIILYPILRKREGINLLMIWVIGRFILWSLSSQQIRFLYPLYVPLSILTASVMVGIGEKLNNKTLKRSLAVGVVGGFLIVTLFFQGILFLKYKPISVILGLESKAEFLDKNLDIFNISRYINENLSMEDLVYFIAEGQSYYCDERCLPDTENSRWTQLVNKHQTVEKVNFALREIGVSHLLISKPGLDFMLLHDPLEKHREAILFLLDEYLPICGAEIKQDDEMILYQLTCD